jgi:adenylate cyclase
VHNSAMPGFLTELKRRNVVRVAIAYTIIAWVIAQALDLATDSFGAPDWVMKMALAGLVAGLPVAAFLAWAFELTPEGVMKTEDVPVAASITPQTGQKLNRLTVAALVLLVGFVAWDKFWPGSGTDIADTDKSVAVLPFADLSERQDQEWFADGLTEEILNALARLPELQVTARTSSFEFKGTNTDISEIANRLGVAHVVEGSVRRIGDELRVTAQLIRAHDGFHLWSETYDRNTEDLFDVQADVAENIAATLDVILDDRKRATMFETGTRSVPAFEAYLKGQAIFLEAHVRDSSSGPSLADANAYFDVALRLDPNFAQVAILHADRYAHFLLEKEAAIVGGSDDLTTDIAYKGLNRDFVIAVNNAPDDLARISAEINREFFQPRWHRIPGLIEQLRAIDPNDFSPTTNTVWLHEVLLMLGEFDLAISHAQLSQKADPLNLGAWMESVQIEIHRDDLSAAENYIDAIRRNLGDDRRLMELEVQIAFLRQDREEAIRLLRQNYEYSVNMQYLKPLQAALEGDYEKANVLIDEIESATPMGTLSLPGVYFAMGDAAGVRTSVRRKDESPIGNVLLGMELAYSGGTLFFDLDDAPNFKARLEEAGVDLTKIKTAQYPNAPDSAAKE